MSNRLQGKRILIVEDDYLLAKEAQDALATEGAIVVGPVSTRCNALALIAAAEIDGAILDVELFAEDSFPVADLLIEKGIPFIFASGVDRARIPKRFDGYRLSSKPVEIRLIARSLFAYPQQPLTDRGVQ